MLFVVRPQKVRSEVDLLVWGHPQEPIILRLHPHPEKQANNNSTKLWRLVTKKRPFQHVEKTCSIVMALLFMLFNALYWPWLLRDEDFDYAKFAATQQNQIKF